MESRNSVTKSRSDGNVDKSSDSFEDNVIIKTAIDNDILHAKSISSIIVGRGIMRVARIVTKPTIMIILLRYDDALMSKSGLLAAAINILSPK